MLVIIIIFPSQIQAFTEVSINALRDVTGKTVVGQINKISLIEISLLYKKDTKETRIVNSVLQEDIPKELVELGIKQEDFDGYIVQFTEEPEIKEYVRLKESRKGIIRKRELTTQEIKETLREYRERVKEEHHKAIQDIKERIPAITGVVVGNRKAPNIRKEFTKTFNGITISDITPEEIEEIKKSDYVKEVFPNYKVNMSLMDSVPLISADDIWLLDEDRNTCASSGKDCLTGKGVTIAIIDTGVDYTHPDLGGCLGPECKVIGGYDFINEDNDPMDDQGHGTHVAGIATGNGVLKGVAPDAKILAYKVLSASGSGTMEGVIASIERAVDPNQDGDFSDSADVISMSLGSSYGNPDDPSSQAVDNAIDNGAVVVVAAGNSGPKEGTIGSPGTARKVITVGASYKKNYDEAIYNDDHPRADQITFFSSRGPVIWEGGSIIKPDVIAPGAKICSTQWNGAFEEAIGQSPLVEDCLDENHIAISGTSMATPIVAGASALLKQAHPDWTPEEIKYALRNTAKKIGNDPDIYGYGRIDIQKAVELQNKPIIANLQTNGEVTGVINIQGSITASDFKDYYVYYGSDSSNLIQLVYSTSLPMGNILFENFDTGYLSDGQYYLKLVVNSIDGQTTEDYSLIEVDNIKLNSPGVLPKYLYHPMIIYAFSSPEELLEKTYLQTKSVDIIGSVGDSEGIISYNLQYANENDPNNWYTSEIKLTGKRGTNIKLGELDLRNLNEGTYIIKLTVSYADGTTVTEELAFVKPKDLYPSWPKSLIGAYNTLADVNPSNAGDEIVIAKAGNYFNLGILPVGEVAVRDSKGNILGNWPQNISFSNWFLPSVADLTGDGDKEIIIASGKGWPDRLNSKIFVFNADGSPEIGWPVGIPDWTPGQTVVEDLNNDGKMEIIVISECENCDLEGTNGVIHVYNADGTKLSGWQKLLIGHSSGYNPVAIGDLDADGNKEIVVSAFSTFGDWYGDLEKGALHIFNLDGTDLEGWPKTIKEIDPNFQFTESNEIWGVFSSPPVLVDLDDNGDLEIIFTIENNIYAFHHDGSFVMGWPRKTDWVLNSPIGIGELDKLYPGPEIVISSSCCNVKGTKLYVYHSDGSTVNGWPKLVCNKDKGWVSYVNSPSPVIADIDGDKNNEIISACIFPGASNTIYAFNSDGSAMNNWPKKLAVGSIPDGMESFALGDVNNDKKLDLLFSTSGSIYQGLFTYLWNLNVPYDESSIEWGTAYGNTQHTGCYKCKPKESVCGDNKRYAPEVCDGIDLAGETCETLGFAYGVLKCKLDCLGFDTSGCKKGFNKCSPEGLKKCDIEYIRTCSDWNNDSYLEWGNDVRCQYGCKDNECVKEISCVDSDVTAEYPDGNNIFIKGNVSGVQDGNPYIFHDKCSRNSPVEYLCVNNRPDSVTRISCPSGYSCSSGVCIGETGCEGNWDCTIWSECVDGQQTRTCNDLNNCGTEVLKPIEIQSCIIASELGPNEYFFKVGNVQTIIERQVYLVNVGSAGSVVVQVGEDIQAIPVSGTKIMEGLEVTVIQTSYNEIKTERSAILKIIEI